MQFMKINTAEGAWLIIAEHADLQNGANQRNDVFGWTIPLISILLFLFFLTLYLLILHPFVSFCLASQYQTFQTLVNDLLVNSPETCDMSLSNLLL